MSSQHKSLDAAATERKARLAKLASLKRKQPESNETVPAIESGSAEKPSDVASTDAFISGRNYDIETRGPKLGFESLPSENHDTVEQHADRIAAKAAEQAAKDDADAEQAIDLFKLQPKKANWDLKRELAERTKVLDVRTQNAIARLVRERIENAKQEAQKKGTDMAEDAGENLGVEGNTLVEAVNLREKEMAAEEQRERELDADDTNP